MVAAVKLTRMDHTAGALRGLAAKSSDAAQVRRLLALALILEGKSRHAAATQAGMDRQTLRDWVHRYNTKVCRGSDPFAAVDILPRLPRRRWRS